MKLDEFKDFDIKIILYIIALLVMFVFEIFTPIFITDGISILKEEYVEVLLLFIFFIASASVYRQYRRQRNKKDIAYMELVKHVGILNRQVEQVGSLTQILKNIPKSKNDIKTSLQEILHRTLEIVSSDWAVIRILDTNSRQTLTEQSFSRGKSILLKYEISNEILLSGEESSEYTIISSNQENIDIKTYCIFPKQKVTSEQLVLISAIVNQAVLLYLIFTSNYYHKNVTSDLGVIDKITSHV